MEIKGFITESYVGHLYKALHGETIEEKFEKLEKERLKLEKEREQTVQNLLTKLNLSIESIAEVLNMPIEKVVEIKKRMDAEY